MGTNTKPTHVLSRSKTRMCLQKKLFAKTIFINNVKKHRLHAIFVYIKSFESKN